MNSLMLVGGGNNYKEPHIKKEKRRRSGEDIEVQTCNEEAYNIATTKLEEYNQM